MRKKQWIAWNIICSMILTSVSFSQTGLTVEASKMIDRQIVEDMDIQFDIATKSEAEKRPAHQKEPEHSNSKTEV